MKNLDGLLNRIQAETLSLVTHRNGATVYKAQTIQGEVFVKTYTRKVGNDRYCEILNELKAFCLGLKLLNKFEWGNYFIFVISALQG